MTALDFKTIFLVSIGIIAGIMISTVYKKTKRVGTLMIRRSKTCSFGEKDDYLFLIDKNNMTNVTNYKTVKLNVEEVEDFNKALESRK